MVVQRYLAQRFLFSLGAGILSVVESTELDHLAAANQLLQRRPKLSKALKGCGLWGALTQQERALLNRPERWQDPQQVIEAGHPFPDDPAMTARGIRSFDDLAQDAAMAAQERNVFPATIDGDFPAKGKAYRNLTEMEWSEVRSIAMERHKTLNWLCGYAPGNCWDETPTET